MIRTRSLYSDGSRLRRSALFALPAAWGAMAVAWRFACPPAREPGLPMRIAAGVVFLSVGIGLVLGVRRGLIRELARARAVAAATQQVLLRPPPGRLEGLTLAAGQLSASRAPPSAGTCTRRWPPLRGADRPRGRPGSRARRARRRGRGARQLPRGRPRRARTRGVLRRLERALERHLRERARDEHPARAGTDPEHPAAEEFVTLLLLEIGPDGRLAVFNCGHPAPYRLGRKPERLPVGTRCPRSACCRCPPASRRTRRPGCCPARPSSCTPTARRRPGTTGAGSSHSTPPWPGRLARRPRPWSAGSTRSCCTTRAAGPPTTSRSSSCGTTAPGCRRSPPNPGCAGPARPSSHC